MLRLKINLRVRRSVRVKCPPPTHHSSLHFTPTVLACRIAANGNAWTISAALPEPRLPARGMAPVRSHADFFWCKMAAQRGWSIEEMAEKLKEVSEKAQERVRCGDRDYPLVTARDAADAAEKGRQRGRASPSPLTVPVANCTV